MTGTCSLRQVCRFCFWPTSRSQCQTSMTVDRPVAKPLARLRLRLREARFLLTQIRLVLLLLSVHTKKYTTLKRKQYRTWPTQMFADIHNVSRLNTNNTNSNTTPYVLCNVFGKQEVASATNSIKALRKTPVAPLCE